MVRADARNEAIGRLEETVMRNAECPNSSERGSQRPRVKLHTNGSAFNTTPTPAWFTDKAQR
eukprot:6209899-Pleurochrysis_carterae.AAC.1